MFLWFIHHRNKDSELLLSFQVFKVIEHFRRNSPALTISSHFGKTEK